MDEISDLTLRAQNKETRIRFGANRRRKNYRMRKARGISPASRTGKCRKCKAKIREKEKREIYAI